MSGEAYEPQTNLVHVESRMVRVDVLARDGRGRIVSGLKPGDFAIWDSGKRQTIATFAVATHRPVHSVTKAKGSVASAAGGEAKPTAAAAPTASPAQKPGLRYVALYFDDLHMLQGDLEHVQVAAENFVRHGLDANDRVAIYTASSTATIDFTANASKLLGALADLRSRARVFDGGNCPRLTPHDAYEISTFPFPDVGAFKVALAAARECNCADMDNADPACYQQQERVVLAQARQMWEPIRLLSENTLETIQAVVNRLAEMPGERVLVLASSGFLTGTLETNVDLLVSAALREGVVVNSLDARGLYMEDPTHGRAQNELSAASAAGIQEFQHEAESFGSDLMGLTAAMADLSYGTGGRLFHNRNDLTAGYYSLAVMPRTEYLLGFVPTNAGRAGSYHKLKVEVEEPRGLYVQARPGYFATARESVELTPRNRIDTEVLGSGEEMQIPLAVSETVGAAGEGKRKLSVQAQVGIAKLPFEVKDGVHGELLTLVAALFDGEGKFVTGEEGQIELALKPESFERFSKGGIGATLSLVAPPGKYRVRVVVEEGVKGQMSATTESVQM